jgi:adenylate cyclase
MQVGLVQLNAARASRGLRPLAHGIGVHFGAVVAGNIGTRERAQYTVIGDVVNVAARLESSTKDQGVPVLFSSAVVERARREGGSVDVTAHGSIHVKGRAQPIDVFTLPPEPSPIATDTRSATA